MRSLRLCVLAVSVAVLATACGSGLSSKDAAKVGGTGVPRSRVDALLAQARFNYVQQGRQFPKPGTDVYRVFQGRATGFLVVTTMYADKAKHEGIDVSDQDVAAAVARRLKSYGSTAARQDAALEAQGSTRDELTAEVRQDLLQQRIQQKIFAGIHVGPGDLEAYYKQHLAKYSSPPSRLVREILVRSPQLANRIAVELHSGADFGALVQKYSEDPGTKANGGRVTIVKGQSSPDIDRLVFSMKTGQISRPLTSADGATRIFDALAPIKPAKATPLSEISDVLRGDVLTEKRREALAAWQLGVKRDYCSGHKIKYAKGYEPAPDDNPCGQNRITPS